MEKKTFKKKSQNAPKALDLHVNLVHGFNTPGVPSRFEGLDIVVIRENTEGEGWWWWGVLSAVVVFFFFFFIAFPLTNLFSPARLFLLFPPRTGEYSGLEHEVVPDVVESLKVITLEKSRRTAEYAFGMAFLNNRKKVFF